MKKIIAILSTLILLPSVYAEECGLTNLASCIPQKIFDFFLNLLNAPLSPLLSLTKTMLETAPSIDIFQGVWAIIIYCLSLFYGFLFVYSGFQFMFSGMNPILRNMAKEWLKNTVMMITCIQASFYLYALVIEMGATMSSAILSLVDPHFFLLTIDNISNVGLEFIFLWLYVFTLTFTVLFLVIRYMLVAMGVIFAPIGIFCYFIPPLKGYGKTILSFCFTNIFITFFDAIIILASSMLVGLDVFANIKILVMISCFNIINWIFIVLAWRSISNSGVVEGGESVAEAVKYIAMFM